MKPETKLYAWHWEQGGYNSCRAESREEAIAKGNAMGAPRELSPGRFTVVLSVAVPTLKEGTAAEKFIQEQDRIHAGMFD